MEYTLKSGRVVTDEDIERMADAIERGELPGEWSGEVVRGRPKIYGEPMVTVPVKFPASVVERIDELTDNRSDYIRRAVAAMMA